MTRSLLRALAVAAVAMGTAVARASPPALDAVTPGWTVAQRESAAASIHALVQAGLPAEAGLDHLQEWMAKGATATQALALIDTFAKSATDGREALRQAGLAPSPVLLEAAAAARRSGIARDALARALSGSPDPDEALARCQAMTGLVIAGFDPAGAAEVVRIAAMRGYQRGDLGEMVRSVRRLVSEGGGPRPALLGELDAAVRRGVRPGDLYSAVSHALGVVPKPGPESGYNHAVLRKGAR